MLNNHWPETSPLYQLLIPIVDWYINIRSICRSPPPPSSLYNTFKHFVMYHTINTIPNCDWDSAIFCFLIATWSLKLKYVSLCIKFASPDGRGSVDELWQHIITICFEVILCHVYINDVIRKLGHFSVWPLYLTSYFINCRLLW